MARDPRKNSAFDSGMRGREKPKIADAHGDTKANDNAGGEDKQAGGKTIGTPGGVDLSAYSSGMRGPEKPKQKPASGSANYGQEREGASAIGTNRQNPNQQVGSPDGHNDAATGQRKGVQDGHLQSTANDAKKLGIPGNNTEAAAHQAAPIGAEGILGEEDDTHIYAKIPKASLKKRGGVNAG